MALLPLENAPAVIESPMHMILMGVTAAEEEEEEEEENGINRRSRERLLYIVFVYTKLDDLIIIFSCYTKIVLVNCLVNFLFNRSNGLLY